MTTPDTPWTPSGRVFLKRALLMGLATFAVTFGMVMLWDAGRAQFLTLGLGLPLAFTLFFFFEDAMRWRSLRAEEWLIEPPHLIHDGPDGRAMIPLADIDIARARMGNVVLLLFSGQRIAMRYLPDAGDVAATINAARPLPNA